MFSLLVFLFIIELYAQMNKLPRWTTFYSFSLSLTSCIFSSNIISDDHYIYHIVLTSYGFRIVAYCIHNFHTQPHIENGVTIGQKIAVNLVVTTCESFKNLLSPQFPVLVIQRLKMSLYKPGQVRAYFFQ